MPRNDLRVTLTPDGFYPRSLRWQGRTVRVLLVEETYTRGLERRYCVRTPEGRYEVGFRIDTGAWEMRRAPTWWRRLWMRIQEIPRYPVAAGRRRGRRVAQARPSAADRQVARPSARVALAAGR